MESADRPDGARRGNPEFYDRLHRGHESVVVEPLTDGGRERLHGLVQAADVVIEASRPRALAGWGLDATELVAGGAVWVSITAYGRGQGDRVGFGDDVAAAAGLVDWNAGCPSFVGDAIADPLTGLAAAVAALRVLTGPAPRGALLDVPMASAAAAALATENIQS